MSTIWSDVSREPREPTRLQFWTLTSVFLGCSVGLAALGFLTGEKALELVGLLLLGGTFIPLPIDVYVLHLAASSPALGLVVVAAALNTAAVLFERWFLLRLFAAGRGQRVIDAVRRSRVSVWFQRAPFLSVFIGGATPLPFEPFRFLAVANGYRVDRYALATFLGRGTRLFVVVAVGAELARFDWFVVLLVVLLGVYLLSLSDVGRLRGLFVRDEAVPEPDDRDA